MEHRRTRIRKLERWLERFDPANPYMAFFHVGTSQEQVKKARHELKILQQQRGKYERR